MTVLAPTVDCWDGDTEPVIYHGRTLTSKISVREVLHAIGKYAFVASPFPIILSMEVHCCVEQQDLLAQIILDVLGSTFLSAPLADHIADETLPSPEQLKYKILLKVRSWGQGLRLHKIHRRLAPAGQDPDHLRPAGGRDSRHVVH